MSRLLASDMFTGSVATEAIALVCAIAHAMLKIESESRTRAR